MSATVCLHSLADRELYEDDAPQFGTWSARATLYGIWTTKSGDQVLFDRRYHPRWRRTPDGNVTPEDPTTWIENIAGERWLYNERTPIAVRRAIGAAVLREWGVI